MSYYLNGKLVAQYYSVEFHTHTNRPNFVNATKVKLTPGWLIMENAQDQVRPGDIHAIHAVPIRDIRFLNIFPQRQWDRDTESVEYPPMGIEEFI